jgi:hypothetical protein
METRFTDVFTTHWKIEPNYMSVLIMRQLDDASALRDNLMAIRLF